MTPRSASVAWIGVIGVLLAGCRNTPTTEYRMPGTARMASRLAELAGSVEPGGEEFTVRVQMMRAMGPPADPRGRRRFYTALANDLLHAGRTEEAVAMFQEVLDELELPETQDRPDFALAVRKLLAASYLRLGVQENCVPPHAAERCQVPIQEDAVYQMGRGPQRAVQLYRRILAEQPDDLGVRWLLNVASMMLGEYPERTPVRWLIPSMAFQPEYDILRFHDIAPTLNLDALGRAGGIILDDFDGDGYLDVMVSSHGVRDQLRYFQNGGDGTLSERTLEAGLQGLVGGLNLIQADYDNDGDLDVFVLRGGWWSEDIPNSLLRNNGDATFEDVTEEAGLLTPSPTQTAGWGDYDNDGWVDLFIGNEPSRRGRKPSQLFHNNGNGTFSDIAELADAAVVGFVKGVVWGDIDNDGRLDLYISRLFASNVLLRNTGPDVSGQWTFTDASHEAGVTEPIESFPTWIWDYDNDGWEDIFVSGYSGSNADVAAEYLGLPHGGEIPRLYRNNGDGTFSDVTVAAGLDRVMLSMGANVGDLDNDGFLDFYVGTGDMDFWSLMPNRMFRNVSGASFQEVTTSGGFGHIHKGHGIAFGDLDNDGDQDIYANMGGALEGDVARNVLFENPGHGNRWITLRLEGVQSNRAAIGARIKITVDTGDGSRDLYSTVSSGGSFGANSLQQEIGLGQARAILALTIAWPSTRTDTYASLPMDRIYAIREGDPAPVALTLNRLVLSERVP